jgi:hypothetical protein
VLNILGFNKRLCDGVTRRELLQAGGSSILGLSLADLLRAPAAARGSTPLPHFGKAKNVILLYLYGAMSQLETLDPKPDAPAEIRGPFGCIGTRLPGVRVGELLPRVADRLDRVAVVRSMSHQMPIHNVAHTVTGIRQTDIPMELNPRDPRHWPFFGSVVDYLDPARGGRKGNRLIPRNVILPWRQSTRSDAKRAGFFGGFLGSRYDPTPVEFQGRGTVRNSWIPLDPYCGIDPRDKFNFAGTAFGPQMTLDRLHRRRNLLDQLADQQRQLARTVPQRAYGELQQIALDFCDSRALPDALSLDREPAPVRQRYGHHLFGQAALLGRRLLEAGSRVVAVLWDEFGPNNTAWDVHGYLVRRMSRELCPGLDQTFAALLDDLEQRGLLDETLVLCLTEHGRTPRIAGAAGDARDHWSGAYSIILAGAGVARGKIIGSSDRHAAFVRDRPVNPKDILRTVYHLLGIDGERMIPDALNRPMPLVDGGQVVQEILA